MLCEVFGMDLGNGYAKKGQNVLESYFAVVPSWQPTRPS